jgi:hypothetical protein
MWNEKEWEIRWKGRNVTLFSWRAVARCCAPSSPIWLKPRLSVVSVYVKRKQWKIRRRGRNVTLFCCRAVARCCAPLAPIWLPWSSSVVSVYVVRKRMRDSMKRWERYIVLLYSSRKMLCSFITDLIVIKVECGECLCETKRMKDSKER